MDTKDNNTNAMSTELTLVSKPVNKLQSFTIVFKQESTEFKECIELSNDADFSTVLGTVLNRLFEINDTMKQYSNSYFRASKDIRLMIISDTIHLDSFKLKEQLDIKLRFGNTAKSRRQFSKAVYHTACLLQNEVAVISMDSLTSKLNSQEQIEIQAKVKADADKE